MLTAEGRLRAAQDARDAETRRRTVLQSVLRQNWADLDRDAAGQRVRQRTDQLALLTTGNHELKGALQRAEEARKRWEAARDADRACDFAFKKLTDQLGELDAVLELLTHNASAAEIPDADAAALEARYRRVQRRLDRGSVGDVGRKVQGGLYDESKRALDALAAARSAFEEGAHRFGARWPAASADLTTSIDDRAGYRALRDAIESRGLPEHQQNFLRLLRERSRDLFGHLLSDIRDAPKLVKMRIDPVNASLGRSPFDRDRYLRIKVKEQRTPEVQQFIADLKTVVDGSWTDEDLTAAEARFAVLQRLMARLASGDNADVAWRLRCLDTREHVTFQAHEVDPAGRVMSVHDSSAGLSGGQRQKLVIFCLAAALRFQLTQDEEAAPSFGTIVLDEAFDKADSTYTRMAMDVFVAFGFHMILATPQKLLSTIEPYVGAVTSITNESRKKSMIANVVFQPAPDAAVDDAEPS